MCLSAIFTNKGPGRWPWGVLWRHPRPASRPPGASGTQAPRARTLDVPPLRQPQMCRGSFSGPPEPSGACSLECLFVALDFGSWFDVFSQSAQDTILQ